MFKQPLIAIDIGSSSIKVVELVGSTSRRLRSVGLEMLPAGAVQDGLIQDQDTVGRVLKNLLQKLKIRPFGRRAAIGLSGSSVLIKKVSIAAQKQSDLSEAVFYEAEQHFQTDMSEIYFDHSKLGEPTSESPETPVLIVGAKRDIVESYISLVRSVGMRTGIVDCDVFATANMVEFNYGVSDSIAAIVNIGATGTQIILVHQGQFVYTRDLPMGGDEYSKRIMELLSIDRENAETFKVGSSSGDSNVPPELTRLLGEINEQIVHEIQLAIDYFLQSGEAPQNLGIGSVFLTGGSSRVLGLDAAMAAALQLPVQIVNPFQKVDVKPGKFQMDYILLQGHLYSVAVGLGLRSLSDNMR
jgi:type IV pilus assembly protein PilM